MVILIFYSHFTRQNAEKRSAAEGERQIEQEKKKTIERERENIRKKVPIMLIKKPKLKTREIIKKSN